MQPGYVFTIARCLGAMSIDAFMRNKMLITNTLLEGNNVTVELGASQPRLLVK